MRFRTEPTVIDGIKTSYVSEEQTDATDYQPGNGTRYPMFFCKLSDAQSRMFGYGANCVMVTIQRFSLDQFISRPLYADGRTLFVREVMEWFGIKNVNDACCVTEMLGERLGSPTDADEVAESLAA